MSKRIYNSAAPMLRGFLDQRHAFAKGASTPRAYLETCLETIEAGEGEIKAFAALNIDAARAAADHSTRRYKDGQARSPVDGMPLGVKDVIETIDMPTGMGSPYFEGWRSNRDAACVRAWREAGGVVLGKTVTCEFATLDPGPTRNPQDLARTPGGSSSGAAAAVGAGFIPASLGTQVVGSILRPASYCGAFGFKPSLGALNRGGAHDYLSQSCLGAIAASLDDLWHTMREIAMRSGGDPGMAALAGPQTLPPAQMPRRVIMLETAGWDKTADDARQALERAIARLEAQGVTCLRRKEDPVLEAFERGISEAASLTRTINSREFRWPLNTYHAADPEALSATLRERLEEGQQLSEQEYVAALERRAALRADYQALSGLAECVITLAATGAAPKGLAKTGDPAFNLPASLLGVPALSLPVLAHDDLPLGVQIIGFSGRDADLFGHAAALGGIMKK